MSDVDEETNPLKRLPHSDLILDEELKEIAKRYGLDKWHWIDDDPIRSQYMMEGAAVCLLSLRDEDGSRDIAVNIHQSGSITVTAGVYFEVYLGAEHQRIKPDDGYEDQATKTFHRKDCLEISWNQLFKGDVSTGLIR